MKKILFSFVLTFCLFAKGMYAQTLPDGMVALLPDGVTANVDADYKWAQYKSLVVAGTDQAGYKAFFAASDDTNGEELWVTDGTAEGTHLVKDINPGTSGSEVVYLTAFNEKVVFSANDGTNGTELWISDGTEAGTYMVKDIHFLDSSNPKGFVQVNETQFVFAAMDFDSEQYGNQHWLWVSDGTADGTEMIYDCDMRYPGQDNGSLYAPYVRVGRKVFFKADNKEGTVGEELWVTDGTTAGTNFLMDINVEEIATGTANSALDWFKNFYNEKLFFKAFTIENGNEPWASDGTPEGTYEIYDCNPTYNESNFPNSGGAGQVCQYPYNGKIYFRGYSPETGYELGCTNLDQGDYTVFDINQNAPTATSNSYTDEGIEFDGVYMFCAATGFDSSLENNFGGEIHYTDGTTVTRQSDLAPGVQSNWAKEFTVVSGSMYFVNVSGDIDEYKQKLFRIDSKDETPVRVCNLNASGDQIHNLRNLGGDLVFAASFNNQVYSYSYRKASFDPASDKDNLEIEFRTRQEIEDDNATAVKDVEYASVTIYPNPASDMITIQTVESIQEVRIYDMAGALVKVVTEPSSNQVNVSNITAGMYIVEVTTSASSNKATIIIK
nr:ELWxxDGT repeat protein [uncultured Carboxylicivirga sp.]